MEEIADEQIDETHREEVEEDFRALAISSMIKFHRARIEGLKTLGESLVLDDMTHRLGLFLIADVKSHEQANAWAEDVLPDMPSPDDDPFHYEVWISCLRVFRRHVMAWSWHPDYWMQGAEILKGMALNSDDPKVIGEHPDSET